MSLSDYGRASVTLLGSEARRSARASIHDIQILRRASYTMTTHYRSYWRRRLWLPVLVATLTTAAWAQQTTTTTTTTTTTSTAVPKESEVVDPKASEKPMKLEEVKVTGSRLNRADIEAPSTAIVYDRRYIDATGAMTLADFLNFLPQNYSGISSGRGSTPNELNPEFGQRTESTLPATNFITGASAAPPGQTGVNGVSVRGLGAGSTLVLVDGRRMIKSGTGNRSSDSRQGFVDLNGIPLGMIERIEVLPDGASAIYGADAVGGVVNIILKKNWNGAELSGAYRGAFHGGGTERSATITTGFRQGKWDGFLSIDYYSRADLKASQRAFSKNQDHTGVAAGYLVATGAPFQGRDLRLNWGFPPVVQGRTTDLPLLLASGVAARYAITQPGITGNATLSQFTASPPSNLNSASGLVRGNTAQYIDLIPESERYGISARTSYEVSDKLTLFIEGSSSNVWGKYVSQPAVVSASATSGFGNFATIVPATINGVANIYNPFGVDVLVGGILPGFGSTGQDTHSKTLRTVMGAKGFFGKSWQWDTSFTFQKYSMREQSRLFNGAAITAALNNPEISLRLNPFLDTRVTGNPQAAIFESMARYNRLDSDSWDRSFEFNADGPIFTLPAGDIGAAVGATYYSTGNKSVAINTSEAVVPVVTSQIIYGSRESKAVYAETLVPIFGKDLVFPAMHRLDFTFAGRYESYPQDSNFVPVYGLAWAPIKSLVFTGRYSESFRTPSLTEYQIPVTTSTSTITDPRRTPASTPNVVVTNGSDLDAIAESSKTVTLGASYEPPFIKGLILRVKYFKTDIKNALQSLSAGTIVNNEALFPGRVTRAAQTAADIAANQPGAITAVDATRVNFGLINNHSMDYMADYDLPWRDLGRWRLSFNASRTLEATRALAPGQPTVVQEGDTGAPPKWKWIGTLMWDQDPFSASVFVNYLDGFATNLTGNSFVANNTTQIYYPTPAVTKVDVRAGYNFKNGVWRGYGKGFRVNVGIANVFDKEPPFSDTVFGYNGGLHSFLVLGRAYEISFVLPL